MIKIARKLERTLYIQAETEADYLEISTLRSRVQKIALDVIDKRPPKVTRRRTPVGVTYRALQHGSSVVSAASRGTSTQTQSVQSSRIEPAPPNHPTSTRVVTLTPPVPKDTAAPLGGKSQVVQQSITPPQLVCPITLKMMADPVIAMDGYSYERAAILQFFQSCEASGQPLRSPTTKELLPGKFIVDNFAIRSQCREYQGKGLAGAVPTN
eukprot:CAMPEP_0116852968 /NCGR_PEP_ID=MMETSP0418-20121206/17617_1 /TAXON_ID=1158023 /ORGANISM="Astrosyne radiata, Strain 13vi08-1A" /LENGTH=210 /DNA_ID=CAMNT_0004485249 /DNA_START=156 /DNA_END=788 /DNA_ORIENTATION=+